MHGVDVTPGRVARCSMCCSMCCSKCCSMCCIAATRYSLARCIDVRCISHQGTSRVAAYVAACVAACVAAYIAACVAACVASHVAALYRLARHISFYPCLPTSPVPVSGSMRVCLWGGSCLRQHSLCACALSHTLSHTCTHTHTHA